MLLRKKSSWAIVIIAVLIVRPEGIFGRVRVRKA